VVLRPAASQDRCQGGMQDLEELRLEKPQGPLWGFSRRYAFPDFDAITLVGPWSVALDQHTSLCHLFTSAR
jgi:hypothetical protein